MLRILGDINFADWYFDQGCGVGTALSNGNQPFSKLKINPDDFWIGNLECVCAEISDSRFPFVISPAILSKIQHVNLYGIANNHIMQAGEDAFNQTLHFLDNKGILYAGSDKKKSVRFEHQGKKIGFLAFSLRPDNFTETPLYWHIPDLSEIQSEIERLSDCDFKIAYIHWGYEFMNRPNIEQRQMAHWLIDSGVDLVIGMHPHVTQGSEVYNGKHIFYSLGNTVFNMSWMPTKYGFMVNVDLNCNKPKVWCDNIFIEDDFFPTCVENVPKEQSLEYLNSLVNITKENEIYFSEARKRNALYTKANRKEIARRMLNMSLTDQYNLISDFIKRRLIKR